MREAADRAHDCSRYRDCLDAAVQLGEDDFTCAGCRQYTTPPDHERLLGLAHDIDGAHNLLIAIFYPAVYAEMMEERIAEAARGRGERGAGDHVGRGEISQPACP